MSPESPNATTLMVRSLNETRLLHPPTYVASRYLADSIASNRASSWSPAAILRRFPVQTPRLFEIVRLKKAPPGGAREYRSYLIPSPMTSLAEAITLSELAKSEAFQKSARVYSYRWPRSPDYPFNFQHFASCYRRRNRAIAAAFRDTPEKVGLITDIKTFYPSIPHDVVRPRFTTALNASGVSPAIAATAQTLFEHVVAHFADRGIATGPEFSHVLGDLALRDLDEVLTAEFPGKYFRYVDDVVLIIDPREKDRALELIEQSLAAVGLELNAEKHDTVSSEEWLGHGPTHKRVRRESFEALIFRLKLYLALHPHQFDELRWRLLSEGFNIPLARVRSASRLAGFRSGVRAYRKRGWKVILEAMLDTPATLVDLAQTIRASLSDNLKNLLDSELPQGPTRRRWHAQRIRYLTNRVLYLLPPEDLQFLEEGLEPLAEFVETSALLKLLRHGDVSELLHMPGSAVTAAASLLQQAHGAIGQIEIPGALKFPEIHSAAVLLLYGVARPPADGQFDVSKSATEFLQFCEGRSLDRRQRNDFTFLDEIQSLQLNRAPEEKIDFLNTRLSDRETSVFEALEIGEEYFS